MSSLLYQQAPEYSDSTTSFLNSAPVEISTVKGYGDFVRKQERKPGSNSQTVFNEDKTECTVLRDGEVIATIVGEAKDHLTQLVE